MLEDIRFDTYLAITFFLTTVWTSYCYIKDNKTLNKDIRKAIANSERVGEGMTMLSKLYRNYANKFPLEIVVEFDKNEPGKNMFCLDFDTGVYPERHVKHDMQQDIFDLLILTIEDLTKRKIESGKRTLIVIKHLEVHSPDGSSSFTPGVSISTFPKGAMV